MTGSVNFNPFLKNVQQIETPEQHKQPAAKPQVEQGGIISGDWQDEENYEIAIGEDNEIVEKYEILYNQVIYAKNKESLNGESISDKEAKDIETALRKYLELQFENGNEELLSQLVPGYKGIYANMTCSYSRAKEDSEARNTYMTAVMDRIDLNKVIYFVSRGFDAPDGADLSLGNADNEQDPSVPSVPSVQDNNNSQGNIFANGVNNIGGTVNIFQNPSLTLNINSDNNTQPPAVSEQPVTIPGLGKYQSDLSAAAEVTYVNTPEDLKKVLKREIKDKQELDMLCYVIDKAVSNIDIKDYSSIFVRSNAYMSDVVLEAKTLLYEMSDKIPDIIVESDKNAGTNQNQTSNVQNQNNNNVLNPQQSQEDKTSDTSYSLIKSLVDAYAANPSDVSILNILKNRLVTESSVENLAAINAIIQEIQNLVQNPPESYTQMELQMNELIEQLKNALG